MATTTICSALQRIENTFSHKPGLALQADSQAKAVLTGGLALEVRHPAGHVIKTDMPTALGGGGQAVPPGWLLRAGLASCTGTVIAMRAERLGIRLTHLEVTAHSRSDARGMLGLDDSVPAGPLEIGIEVDIRADGVADEVLAELVAWADAHSPVGSAVRRALDLRTSVNSANPPAH